MFISTLFLLLLISPQQENLPVLEAGKTLNGKIEESDPAIKAGSPNGAGEECPVRGDRYVLVIADSGTYTIEMRSLYIDTYLLIRDETGNVLAEDDNGFYGRNSRIEFTFTNRANRYYLEACALHGSVGGYEVRLIAGRPSELSAEQKQAALFSDAREKIRIAKEREGEESLSHADALYDLASLHHAEGNFEGAKSFYVRAIHIRRKSLGPESLEAAETENHYAGLLLSHGKYPEAESHFKHVLRVRETALGPEHADTVASIEHVGLTLFHQGKYEEAKSYYERLHSIKEKTLGPEHPDTLMAVMNRATVNYAQGRYDAAKRLFEHTLLIRERKLGARHADTIMVREFLARCLNKLGRYEEARQILEGILCIKREVYGPEHPETAQTLENLAILLSTLGEYEKAKTYLERAYRIKEREFGSEHSNTVTTLHNLAVTLSTLGDYEQARLLHERVVRTMEKTFGAGHPFTATALATLAKLLENQGDFEEAEVHYERAIRISEILYKGDHACMASTINNLAVLHYKQGRYDEANDLFKRALGIYETVFGLDHPESVSTLYNLAVLLQAQGRDEEAVVLYRRAFAIWERTLGTEHMHVAKCLHSLAMLLSNQGRFEEARAYYDRALRIKEKVLPDEHPEIVDTLCRMAENLIDQGKMDEAWETARRVVACNEEHMKQILWSLSELERLKFAALKRKMLDTLLTLAFALPSTGKENVAYETLIRWKGVVSRSLLKSGELLVRNLSPEVMKILLRMKEVKSQLSKEIFRKEVTDPKGHCERLKRLQRQHSELEQELARHAGKTDVDTAVTLADCGSALSDSAAFIDFYVHRWYKPAVHQEGGEFKPGERSEPHLSAWVYSKNEENVTHLDLGPSEPIRTAVHAFLNAMVESGELVNGNNLPDEMEQANAELRNLLWNPIAPHLEGVEEVYISPDGFLGTFPFEALRLDDRSYLIEHYVILYLQDITTLVTGEGRNGKAVSFMGRGEEVCPSLFVVGGVDYERRIDLAQENEDVFAVPATAEPRQAKEAEFLARAENLRGFKSDWRPLIESNKEIDTIVELHEKCFGDGGKRLELRGAEATEGNVKAALSEYNIIHLATHGFFQPDWLPSLWKQVRDDDTLMLETDEYKRHLVGMMPGFLSGLVLAGANDPSPGSLDDGYITAEELSWLNLSEVNLAVLSACETGLGSPTSGEGILGMGRALRREGVDSVITSLWRVHDEATSRLFTAFYRHLWMDGMKPAEALRKVKLDMIHGGMRREKADVERGRISRGKKASSDYNHPYFWAAFVCWGE